MNRDISPEEKLLRLIRLRPKKESNPPDKREDKGPESGDNVQAENIAKPDHGPEPKKKVKAKAESLNQPSQVLPQLRNIIFINKLLFLTFTVLIIYFLVDYFFLPSVEVSDIVSEEVDIAEMITDQPVSHPYSYYSNEIVGKDIFKALPVEVIEEDSEEDEAELEEIISNLGLLGLVTGASPQAIIQDNRKKKSYFLKVGDKLGSVELKEILEAEGKVVMIYKDKEFDLGM